MKKLIAQFLGIFMLGMVLMSCDKDEIISDKDIPTASQKFISDYFNGAKVISTIKDNDGLGRYSYEVKLDNGVEMKFDKNGNWIEVGHLIDTQALPNTGFINTSILQYVKANFAQAGINSIEKENYGFDVELTNGIDLVFDNSGNFVRVDD